MSREDISKLELYIDIANQTESRGMLNLGGNYFKQVIQLLALIKDKDYANINIMCLDTSTNGIYDTLYSQPEVGAQLEKAKDKYNINAFTAPTSNVGKPALVFIERGNANLVAKESFKTNILANKKAIIIQYDEDKLLPIIIILSLIAYNSLDNDVINGIVTDERERRKLADIRLDFADEKAYLKNNNTNRPAKLKRLEEHAKYLQIVPKLAEIKELEVVTPQFEAKATKDGNRLKNSAPGILQLTGGALRTDMPNPITLVTKMLDVLREVIIPKEVAKLVIDAKKRKPEYFKAEGMNINEVSLSKILEYVVQRYTQKEIEHFNDNTNQRKTNLHDRQWKFLKESKNISKIRYCKLAIEHIKRGFGNAEYTVTDDLEGDAKILYDNIMNYGITYGEGHTLPQPIGNSKAGQINILLMDKAKTKEGVAGYIDYVTKLLEKNNKKNTIMLYSKESIPALKLLFQDIDKEPTEADYNFMFKNEDLPGHNKRGLFSRFIKGAKGTKKAFEKHVLGKESNATKKRMHKVAVRKDVSRIGLKPSTDGLSGKTNNDVRAVAKVTMPTSINPEKETSAARREHRAERMKELIKNIPALKTIGKDVIGYKALSIDKLQVLINKYKDIMVNDTKYKEHEKDISKDLGITLSADELTNLRGPIRSVMRILHLYYSELLEMYNLGKNGEYKLKVGEGDDSKEYDLKVSTDSTPNTVTFPYPTKATDLTTMSDNIEKLLSAAIGAANDARIAKQKRLAEAAIRASKHRQNYAATTVTTTTPNATPVNTAATVTTPTGNSNFFENTRSQ